MEEDRAKIAHKKYRQSPKGKAALARSHAKYMESEKGKEALKKAQSVYEKSEKAKARRKAYLAKPEVKARLAELARLRKAKRKAQED